jgi:hypothetical protein
LAFGNQQAQAQQWEEDKARVLALSKQAGDTVGSFKRPVLPLTSFSQMADLSEATLDSIVSTVEVLKAVST